MEKKKTTQKKNSKLQTPIYQVIVNGPDFGVELYVFLDEESANKKIIELKKEYDFSDNEAYCYLIKIDSEGFATMCGGYDMKSSCGAIKGPDP